MLKLKELEYEILRAKEKKNIIKLSYMTVSPYVF